MKLLEVGNLDGIFVLILGIMFGPAILLALIGATYQKNNKKTAKTFFILAAVYVIISLGICGSMLA